MANKYDPPRMKRGAEDIEAELRKFREAKELVNSVMSSFQISAFDDDTGRRFTRMYTQEAKVTMEEMDKTLTEFVSLLKMCAKKFGNAIDNGNSFLSS